MSAWRRLKAVLRFARRNLEIIGGIVSKAKSSLFLEYPYATLVRMKRLITVVSLVLVAGCQDRTEIEWLDPFVVRDYEDRVDLTNALDLALPLSARRRTYCDYGCDHVCSIDPEPTIYADLDQRNRERMSEAIDQAEGSGLAFDVEKSGIIYDPRVPLDLSPEEVAPAKLTCLQRQREHIERIETLLDKLVPDDG